jgi:hypothetical protein
MKEERKKGRKEERVKGMRKRKEGRTMPEGGAILKGRKDRRKKVRNGG